MRTPEAGLVLAACFAVALGACRREAPVVGDAVTPSTVAAPAAPVLTVTAASVNAARRVVVALRLEQAGAGLSLQAAEALQPRFTLASLERYPATVTPAWKSHLLVGAQTIPSLPVAGPGTPTEYVIPNARQPGSEGGALVDLGGGDFQFTFATPLAAGYDPAATFRVGAFLEGVTSAAASTCATLDFVPGGGALSGRDTVLDARCNACHALLRAHQGRRAGVKLCLTCHTWQNADPDTVDPAAPVAATAATSPNPLDLGRLVHRIHRGKNLPTQYQVTSATLPAAPALPSATALPLPFVPVIAGGSPPVFGRKYSVRGEDGLERYYARVIRRADNGQPTLTLATGVVFPQDYRNCDACHAGAPQAAVVHAEISRRSCHGCHTEAWFETATPPDVSHFAHPGGPQPDDTRCAGCHVAGTKVYAPISDIHVALQLSPHRNDPIVEIVEVRDFTPGKKPTIVFEVSDRNGPLDRLGAPTPALDQAPKPSPLPRALAPYYGLSVTIGGPTAPDYASRFGAGAVPVWDYHVPLTLVPDASGRFSYTPDWVVPADASGTWTVGFESRKSSATTHYDPATDTFRWPYTGEAYTEGARNPLKMVDVTDASGAKIGTPAPRREVVTLDGCNGCHQRITFHGGLRSEIGYCLICHNPQATDWGKRPKDAAGNVAVGATYDGIEERSIQLKVLVHRIHTGGRSGAASLQRAEPFVVYGMYGLIFFFDEGIFPGDLADCRSCHVGRTYEIESVPEDAPPTLANETPALRHAASDAHVAGEPAIPPIQSACLSCHDADATRAHAVSHTTSAGEEQCLPCHGTRAANAVWKVHGIPQPPAP